MQPLKFIIGHKRPAVRFPADFRFVTDSPQEASDVQVPLAEVHSLGLTDARIGEYAFLFALRRVLHAQTEGSVCIAQYRRLVLNQPIGAVPHNVHFARVISPAQFHSEVTDAQFLPKAGDWLLSSVARPSGNVLTHYARYHVLRDWMRFCSDAIDSGALSNADALAASAVERLIPAPSNGVFPLSIFHTHLHTLEHMALAFLNGGFVDREEYQRRALGFCLERMHSFLLLQGIKQHQVDMTTARGYHTVISEEAAVRETR
jgi:hypothetical protein